MSEENIVPDQISSLADDPQETPQVNEDVQDNQVDEDTTNDSEDNDIEQEDVKQVKEIKTETPVEKKPEFNPDEFKQKVKDELTQEVTKQNEELLNKQREDILKALGIKKEEATPEQNDYAEALQDVGFLNEKRNPATFEELMTEVLKASAKYTLKQMQKEQEARVRSEQEAKQKEVEAEKEVLQELNGYWDDQLNTLVTSKLIPDMSQTLKDKLSKGETLPKEEVEKDPGAKARRDLFTLAAAHQTRDLELTYYKWYKPSVDERQRQPDGSDAPVSMGKGQPTSSGDEFYYEDIHGKRPIDLLTK